MLAGNHVQYKDQPLDWPLDQNIIRRNSEAHTFGMVRTTGTGQPKAHQGWDLEAALGTPVYSIGKGEVIFSGPRGDYGICLIIWHREMGVYSFYAHLSELMVQRLDFVVLGELIALTGNSGNAQLMKGKDQHLHFEIRLEPYPGLGLSGRISPYAIYQKYPLATPEKRNKYPFKA